MVLGLFNVKKMKILGIENTDTAFLTSLRLKTKELENW